LLRASLPAIGALLVVLLLPAVGHAAEVGVVVTEGGEPLRVAAARGAASRLGDAGGSPSRSRCPRRGALVRVSVSVVRRGDSRQGQVAYTVRIPR